MALGPDDLVLCAGTLARTPLLERIEIAAAAGFQGVSLFLDDIAGLTVDDEEFLARMAHLGLEVAELDPLLTWVPERETGSEGFERWGTDDFFNAAARVSARSFNAVCFSTTAKFDDLVVPFGQLCDRAADAGVHVHIEFMPFSPVNDLSAALRLVEECGRDNAGIMFDVWHYIRSGSTPEMLARAASRVTAIQLDDAPAKPAGNIIEETLHHRLLPGEGDADVPELIRILDQGGCRAPLGVEVFSDDLMKLNDTDVATRVVEATRKVVAAARPQARE